LSALRCSSRDGGGNSSGGCYSGSSSSGGSSSSSRNVAAILGLVVPVQQLQYGERWVVVVAASATSVVVFVD
jgi:hypothetical protein